MATGTNKLALEQTMEEFGARFREKSLLANYECRLERELELRTNNPDESLLEYSLAMGELYHSANPHATNFEKVECVTQQTHLTFAAYLRGGRFKHLD